MTTVDVTGIVPNECTDYILCAPDVISVLGVLECHPELVLHSKLPLPNHVFPSDHVSLKAKLALK